MKYVRVDNAEDLRAGYSLNPDEYLKVLPEVADELPPGAREFALDEAHYNFFGSRCVKDLKLDQIITTDRNDRVSVKILFAPNKFKHDEELLLRYVDVVGFSVDVVSTPRDKNVGVETRRLGDLQLDEILPHDHGCSHDIQLTGGVIRVVAADLTAQWRAIATEIN